MPEWLRESLGADVGAALDVTLGRLAVALALGCVVAGVYRRTHRRGEQAACLVPTLVLLTVLIALVTQVIGNSVARAFSLVGALSIVRFRTVVQDTRDTAFVIFAVVVGMCVGAGAAVLAGAGVVVVGAAAFLVRPPGAAPPPAESGWLLSVRLGVSQRPEGAVDGVLGKHLEAWQVLSASTARQGAALDVGYRVRFRRGTPPTVLVAELNQVEGVQEVELRQASPGKG